MSKIIVKNTSIDVKGFYPFRYPNGKLCLRFEVDNDDIEFAELYNLLNDNQEPIEYYENDEDKEPKITYYKYTDFTCQYNGGVFSVEQVSPSILDSVVEGLQQQTEKMTAIIDQQTFVINQQADAIGMLTECALDLSTIVYQEPIKEGGELNEE